MKGKIDQAKGHAKQAVGDLTGNRKLIVEGAVDIAAGKTKEAIEDVTEVVDKAKKKIKEIRK